MIKNFNKKSNDKNIVVIIAVILIAVWFCTPPFNKFLQLAFWGNNINFFIARMTHKADATEYIFHRNNAIYLARMGNKNTSIKEIDLAIATFPTYASDFELSKLYKDRAQIRLFYSDYKGALNDYMKVKDLELTDRLKIALLYKQIGKNKLALSYCNSILNIDPNAYAGFACVADVYAGAGRPDASVRVYNLLIDRQANKAKYYADRAYYKQLCGDKAGYNADMAKAKELNSFVDVESNFILETIHPKVLTLTIT